ncbi:MAG: isoprenylcysteine carboxylmethyltransferase family protein [Chloroflexi bacterium]|nr:isoprenylcysteine carboxylmethyltransferase family protein [Chloroflexota bacterium]
MIFQVSLAILSALLALIRLSYGGKAYASRQKIVIRRVGKIRNRLLWPLGSLAATASIAYMISPALMRWSEVSLTVGLRWIGVFLGAITVLLFLSIHQALGDNWAMLGVITDRQTLITTGPYHWVRHPMYMTLYVWTAAYFFISANWFIGASWLGLAVVATSMVPEEEQALIEKFGEAYRSYMQRAGRFLPSLKRKSTSTMRSI